MSDFLGSSLSSGSGQFSPPIMGQLAFAQVPLIANLYDSSPAASANFQGLIFVAGQYVAGDGGGGFFHWSPNSIIIDDGFNVILPTGRTGPGRWQRSTITLAGVTNLVPFSTNISAEGNNQASATQLQALINVVTVVPNNTSGVQLPTTSVGTQIQIFNRGSNSVYVYPPFSMNIEDDNLNLPFTIGVDQANTFTYQGGNNWLVEYFDDTELSVLNFGADPTATLDSTFAFMNCFAALPNSGGTIKIPDGDYQLSGSGLNLVNKPVALLGSSMGASVIHYSGTGTGLTVTQNAVSNITVMKDLQFKQNGPSGATQAFQVNWPRVSSWGSCNCIIENVFVFCGGGSPPSPYPSCYFGGFTLNGAWQAVVTNPIIDAGGISPPLPNSFGIQFGINAPNQTIAVTIVSPTIYGTQTAFLQSGYAEGIYVIAGNIVNCTICFNNTNVPLSLWGGGTGSNSNVNAPILDGLTISGGAWAGGTNCILVANTNLLVLNAGATFTTTAPGAVAVHYSNSELNSAPVIDGCIFANNTNDATTVGIKVTTTASSIINSCQFTAYANGNCINFDNGTNGNIARGCVFMGAGFVLNGDGATDNDSTGRNYAEFQTQWNGFSYVNAKSFFNPDGSTNVKIPTVVAPKSYLAIINDTNGVTTLEALPQQGGTQTVLNLKASGAVPLIQAVGFFARNTNDNVQAAGTNLATATALNANINIVTGGTGGVALPPINPTTGVMVRIINRTGATINVYPANSGYNIDGAANTSQVSGALGDADYIVTAAGNSWTKTSTTGASAPGRLLLIQQISTSQTIIPPAGWLGTVIVEGTGGGGGGAGTGAQGAGSAQTGGGGGSGSYAKAEITYAQFGGSQLATIGTGGAGGAATGTGNNGTNGGETSLGSLLFIPGGTGGIITAGTTAVNIAGGGTSGGTPSFVGITQLTSKNGECGQTGFAISGAAQSGAGGSTPLGTGGTLVGGGTVGVNGDLGGGGGSAGATASGGAGRAGGNGGGGLLTFYWYS